MTFWFYSSLPASFFLFLCFEIKSIEIFTFLAAFCKSRVLGNILNYSWIVVRNYNSFIPLNIPNYATSSCSQADRGSSCCTFVSDKMATRQMLSPLRSSLASETRPYFKIRYRLLRPNIFLSAKDHTNAATSYLFL